MKLCNAKGEFLNHTKGRDIKAASVGEPDEDYRREAGSSPKRAILPVGYTEEQLTAFLSQIDYDYDDGYGCQNLFGTIWYSDGTWSDRGEYDGSEWWRLHVCPAIPEELSRTFANEQDLLLESK